MATISPATNEKTIGIKQFLGMHEDPDGDNKLKLGEGTVCRNFRITQGKNLKKRPGTALKYTLDSEEPVKGMWHGWVAKREIFVAACANKLWLLMDEGAMKENPVSLGTYNTDNDVCFFGFEEKLYCLNGSVYAVLDYVAGAWTFTDISTGSYGYRPLVTITVPPAGGGELLEQTNKLNGLRRCWISPDGVETVFHLPEQGITNVYVTDLATNTTLIAGTDYNVDGTNGTVTFTNVPPLGVNTYEIGWTYPSNFASTVKAMRYAELYAGTQDNRVFLYGDGSNHAFYSGLDYDGKPRADYFPDLNEVAVGDANTPISAMIRHYGRLLAFKNPVGCYALDYGVVTLADTNLTPAFYSTPLNKIIGNEALGQVQLVLNAPITLCAGHLFEWRNGSSYSANVSIDERQAKRISDRVYLTLQAMDFSKVHCYDDNMHQEYYVIDDDGNALVHNYVADAWYYYTGVDARMVIEVQGEVYIGTKSGKILHFSEEYLSDQGEEILCRWESGSIDFGSAYMRKYSPMLWVGLKAEANNEVVATVQTDRTQENAELVVDPPYDSDIIQIKRAKVKVKKFTNYKLIFYSETANTTATVVDAEIQVRFTSKAK